ncbi:MAG: hypothetical protein ACFN0W_10505 [Propionibacterium acidifaciens]|uniref:hypothetical protein n=1 Tax=Propionibacterium acidifaciens TaxID=556499 RepID=UPI0036123087
MNIPIGKIGFIESGSQAGFFIKIIHDTPSHDSGYYILTNRNKEYYDNWVADYESLKGFFAEVDWIINWDIEDVNIEGWEIT